MAFVSRKAIVAAVFGASLSVGSGWAQDDMPNPPIWVVEDEDSTIYMIGTVHTMRAGVVWQNTAVADALRQADELWLEIDTLEPEGDFQDFFLRVALSLDRPLSDVLDDDEQDALTAILAPHGIAFSAYDTLRPWYAYVQLSVLAMREAGLEPENGMDVQLEAQAQAQGIAVRGFETFESQIEMLSGMSDLVQLDVLRETIAEYDETIDEAVAQLESWIDGDLSVIEAATIEIAETTPEFYQALFADRNAAFADGIEEILAGQGTALVALGLGHFVGPDSIPQILSERGHGVERR